MNLDERLAQLEKTVKGFNLVQSGTDQISGGFGELKPKATIEERVAHLEHLHDNFRIVGGRNVSVEGSLKNGFAICATCPQDQGTGNTVIPTPPPQVTCPDTLTVTFHNVVFDCGCVLNGLGGIILTDIGLFNDSPIELAKDTPDPGCETCLYFWSSGSTELHAVIYSDTDCTTIVSTSDAEFAGNILLWLDVGGLWHLKHQFVAGIPLVFYGTSTDLSLPFNNLATCSHDVVTFPDLSCTTFDQSVASHDGYATIV